MDDSKILESWKEIAAHLNRNVRTCQMWERDLGLPIHRLDGSPKARVFAYASELDAWREEKLREPKAPGTEGKARWVVSLAPILLLMTFAGFFVWRFLFRKNVGGPVPIDNSIAIISFENQTGDEALDAYRKIIPNLLITSLEQTRRYYVMSIERLRDILRQAGKGDAEFIDSDLGFEVCRRDGVMALVAGSYYRTGDTYFTDVKVLDVRTKRLLRTAKAQGSGPESLFVSQVDELSRQIAAGIGLDEQQLAVAQKPISDLTTHSVEAYGFYLRGVDEYYKLNYEDSRRYLEKATEVDPSFAIAQLCLSRTYRVLADPKASQEALNKAIKLSEKASIKEKLQIERAAADYIEKDPAKALAFLRRLVEAYPREKEFHQELGTFFLQQTRELDEAVEEYERALGLDPEYAFALNMLGLTYMVQGIYGKALATLNRYVEVSPGDANPLDSVAAVYYAMGDLDKAIEKYIEALAVKPDFFTSLIQIPHVYALKEDYPESVNWLDRLISIVDAPGLRLQGYYYLGFHDFWRGRTASALDDIQRASDIAKELGNRGAGTVAEYLRGWIALDQGDYENSRRCFTSQVDTFVNVLKVDNWKAHLVRAHAALALGLAELRQGRIEPAKSHLKEIDSVATTDDDENFRYHRDILCAEISLAEGAPEKAIALFEKRPTIKPPSPQWWELVMMYNMPPLQDVLGRAYAQKGDLDKAIAAYEQFTRFDPKGKSRHLIHPKYHYSLAKLYELKGQKAKAAERYRRFLDLWKDADPGTAEVEEAKKRLAALDIRAARGDR